MTTIALFHSVLGVRQGIHDAADRFRSAGHDVVIIDQYDGRTFDDYDEAGRFVETIGFPALMQKAVEAVQVLPGDFIAAGFSNGAGMAEFVATRPTCRGVLLLSGAVPLSTLGIAAWPSNVPAQIHYTTDDPFRNQEWIDELTSAIRAADAPVELFDYPGRGHLFTDRSLPAEYDAEASARLWERVVEFCRQTG